MEPPRTGMGRSRPWHRDLDQHVASRNPAISTVPCAQPKAKLRVQDSAKASQLSHTPGANPGSPWKAPEPSELMPTVPTGRVPGYGEWQPHATHLPGIRGRHKAGVTSRNWGHNPENSALVCIFFFLGLPLMTFPPFLVLPAAGPKDPDALTAVAESAGVLGVWPDRGHGCTCFTFGRGLGKKGEERAEAGHCPL